MKKEVEQFALKEKAIQSQKEQVSAFILSVDEIPIRAERPEEL